MLKEIKTRYAGKCADCGREIKVGWDIFFDPETKKVYCKPCGSTMGGQETSAQVFSEAEIAELPEDLQTRMRDAGMIKEPTPEENMAILLDALRSDISAIREATIIRLDVISGGVSAIIDCIGSLADDINTIKLASNKTVTFKEPAKSTEKTS